MFRVKESTKWKDVRMSAIACGKTIENDILVYDVWGRWQLEVRCMCRCFGEVNATISEVISVQGDLHAIVKVLRTLCVNRYQMRVAEEHCLNNAREWFDVFLLFFVL